MFVLKDSFSLIISLTKRDIESRYKNSILGLVWSIAFPLFMLAIYSFVFGFIFKSKWHGSASNGINYSLIMFVGLVLHTFISDCLGRATTVIESNANYVKKVIFPLESLCWVSLLSALFQFFISFIVLFGFLVLGGNKIHITILLVPILILPFILLCYAFILFISALSVYIKDIAQMMSIFISILLFMSPVFYSVSSIPEKFRWMIFMNPSTFIINSMRKIVLYGEMFSIKYYLIYFVVSFVLYFMALKWFKKLKGGFSEVL